MAIDPGQEESARIQETLISIGAKISESIRSAVQDAADNIDATVNQRVGRQLVSTFTNLAKLTDTSANNTFRLSKGILKAQDISKQIQTIEEKRLSLLRQYEIAKNTGIQVSEEDKEAALEILDAQQARLSIEQQLANEVESQIGLTGKLAGALSKIPGLGKLINAKEIDEELRALSVTVDANGNAMASGISKTALMTKGLGMAAKQVGKGLIDPLTILLKIGSAFLEVNKASVEFQRLTGQNAVAVGGLNTRFATTVDFLKTAAELTQQIGLNATSIFGPDQLAAVAEAKNLLGLSAEEAGNLALQSKISGNTIDSFQDGLLAGADAANRMNKSVVAPGIVLKDVLNTSKGISASLGNNPERLGKAATAARAFGMELKQVDSIASSLLNFESSIEAELEAQLLTGKNINLAKAREFALTNDLEGLSAELAKNGASAAEFANMNRIAQEALAKSVGMSRDDLAKSILLQESSKDLSEEQRASVLGVTKEQLQQVGIQERLNKSIDKLAQAFAPILDTLVPVVDLLGSALQIASLIAVPFTSLIKLGESFGGTLGKIVAGLVAAGVAALILNSSLTFGVGAAIALAAAGAGIMFLKSSTKIGDLNSPAEGKTVVSTKEGGLFELSPNDDLIAAPGASAIMEGGAAGGMSISIQPLVAEIQSMKQELKSILTTIANKEGSIYLDSDLVGKGLVLGSTRV